MDKDKGTLLKMNNCILPAQKCVEALLREQVSQQRFNTFLDAGIHQMELACIEMRRLVEQARIPVSTSYTDGEFIKKEVYGYVTVLDTGWLHIRLNTLLPRDHFFGGTAYLSDSITRLLRRFQSGGGTVPFYDQAFLAIVEHCDVETCRAFDHDNKAFQSVINALKGRVFPDDNQFELSLGLFTRLSPEACCHIYVLPVEEAGDFLFCMQANEV